MADLVDDRLYGRRLGRTLRPAQQRLLDEALPARRIVLSSDGLLDPGALFARRPDAIWLEIGFGGGEHMAWQAASHPGIGVIGCEAFLNGTVQALGHLQRLTTDQVRIWPGDARRLLDQLPDRSIARAFLLFPDPWPKRRHHRRRFVQSVNLDRLARVLVAGAELRMATDDADYMAWMLFETTRHGAFDWAARRASDWRVRPPDWPETRYERKARGRGLSPWFLRFIRR